jgi:4-hydroxy-3-methylbut-2-enyl diphosphate reductase IspH
MSVTRNSHAGVRTVLLASRRSFCAGVERAIAVVEQLLDQRGAPIAQESDLVLVVGSANSSNLVRLVEAVITALATLGPVTVIEREITREVVRFTLPSVLRRS